MPQNTTPALAVSLISFICVGYFTCAQTVALPNSSDGYNCSQAFPVTGLITRVPSLNEPRPVAETPQPGSGVWKLSSNAALRVGLQPAPAAGVGALPADGAGRPGSVTATLSTRHSLRSFFADAP